MDRHRILTAPELTSDAAGDFVGRPYTRWEMLASEYAEPSTIDDLRAFEVPRLIGQTMEAGTERDIPAVIVALLSRHLPPHDWDASANVSDPLRKYGIVHTSLAAPLDGDAEPMWIELAGEVIGVAGRPYDPRTTSWLELRAMSSDEMLETEVPGPICVRITVATYANTPFPGIGVPFYF